MRFLNALILRYCHCLAFADKWFRADSRSTISFTRGDEKALERDGLFTVSS